MSREVYKKVVDLVLSAAELAKTVGIRDILQPGLIKEMIVAETLGHEIIHSKRAADARDANDPAIQYEYLTCKEGGAGQLDRMFKEPPDKRPESLNRIWRNKKIYLAVFFKSNPTKIKTIYELEPSVVASETERKLDRSRNAISHVGFSENWARQNGVLVYQDDGA
ncbi:MAG: hypothetical protein KDA47_01495 [Planctomycetales bacterium]|nr:hypothetical protein [Planctomycetales bacterium]